MIAALKQHEIGYHSNYHSIHPTPAEYLQSADWDEGVEEFYRREISGVKDIQRIFGVTPSCYGQPGSSWGPQSYPALKQMGINVYLDEANQVGIDDQPFYYGGMLNIFKMRSNVCRMELFGENNLANGKVKFLAAYEKLKTRGGGTISIYYHPCEWVHSEFWDGVNFSRGANPMRKDWKLPKTRTSEETDKAFRDFAAYVKFIKAQAGVRYVTANELKVIYADRAALQRITGDYRYVISEAVRQEITFLQAGSFSLSAAEIFSLLTKIFMANYTDWRGLIRPQSLLGPTRRFAYDPTHPRPAKVSGVAFAQAVREVATFCQKQNRVPNEVWIGSQSISPPDYLATLAAFTRLPQEKLPAEIEIITGKFTADKYVADDDPKIFNWVIHPEGFHAPKIMELAKLQAWTLKPAVMKK